MTSRKVALGQTQFRAIRPRIPLPPAMEDRMISVWWEGQRTAKARRYASGTELTAGFYNPESRRYDILRRLRFDQICGVYWRGELVPLNEWAKLQAAKAEEIQ